MVSPGRIDRRGRGGIGRRAALSGRPGRRGSSSLLDRTILSGSVGPAGSLWQTLQEPAPCGPKIGRGSLVLGSVADQLREAALDYHRLPRPGKLAVVPTKPLATQRDLSLAYSPGVAAACERDRRAIRAPAAEFTARGNLVAVVTNGTAVLGLGDIGAARRQAGDGGQGASCSRSSPASTSSTSRSTSATRTSWSTSSPRSSPPSAASTSRTSRRPSASTSRASCASG